MPDEPHLDGDTDAPVVALEPDTLPNRPLTAEEASPFLEKEIG
jgi:hypothetical protein